MQIIFGCGADCIAGFMVDVRDGKIYDLPLGESNYCYNALDIAVSNVWSKLFISSVCQERETKEIYYLGFVRNENLKSLKAQKT